MLSFVLVGAVFASWLVLRWVCCAGGVWLLFGGWFGALVDCVLTVVRWWRWILAWLWGCCLEFLGGFVVLWVACCWFYCFNGCGVCCFGCTVLVLLLVLAYCAWCCYWCWVWL